jgi:hypothetical protein
MPFLNPSLGRESPYIALLIFVPLVFCLPLILNGVQMGDSLVFNLAWSRAFNSALYSGDLYPRWLDSLANGAGSPAFFFYAPLPFYILSASNLLCLHCAAPVQLGIGEALLFIASGFSLYVVARLAFAERLPCVVGALLYALMPYHFLVDLLHRQDIGEITCYIWMPIILYFTNCLIFEKKNTISRYKIVGLATSYFCLVTSHLPTTVLFSGMLLVYAVVANDRRPILASLGAFFAGTALGIGLSGIYIIPALSLLKYIRTAALLTGYYDYKRWFFFDGITANPIFSRDLSLLLLASTVSFTILWVLAWGGAIDDRRRRQLLAWLVIVIGAWFLMTPLSAIVWRLLPMLRYIQFPWRVAVVLDLAVSVTAIFAMHDIGTDRKWASWWLSGAVTLLFLATIGAGTRHIYRNWRLFESGRNEASLESAAQTGCTAVEYVRPKVDVIIDGLCAKIKELPTSRVSMDPTAGKTRVLDWEPREVVLAVDAVRQTRLIIRQSFFPGWQASISNPNTGLIVGPSKSTGLIQVEVPPGHYRLSVHLSMLPSEVGGAAVSGGSLLVLIVLAGLGIRQRARRPKAHDESPFEALPNSHVGRLMSDRSQRSPTRACSRSRSEGRLWR